MPASPHRARLVTLAFVRHGEDVLLLRHPPDARRFAGRWNGVGGHVEPGEDVRAAAAREVREEAGIEVVGLRLRAVIHESGLLGESWVVFVFTGEAPGRTLDPAPGHELAWHPVAAVPSLHLVDDLRILLPRVLGEGDPIFVTESYDGGDARLALAIDGVPVAADAPRAGRAGS